MAFISERDIGDSPLFLRIDIIANIGFCTGMGIRDVCSCCDHNFIVCFYLPFIFSGDSAHPRSHAIALALCAHDKGN